MYTPEKIYWTFMKCIHLKKIYWTFMKCIHLKKMILSSSNRVFPYYQGESTIFDKGNFLYQTPDTKNL